MKLNTNTDFPILINWLKWAVNGVHCIAAKCSQPILSQLMHAVVCVCVLVFVYKKIFFEFAVHFSNDESESVDSTTFFLVYHPKV